MVQHAPVHQQDIIDIGDGLRMRWSTSADTENVAELIGDAFRFLQVGKAIPDDQIPDKNELLMSSVRRLLKGDNIVMSQFDYALVENTKATPGENPIVAAVSLHEIPGYYGCVPLTYGKPELIACNPAFRNRGLIRRLMKEMIHTESERRGHLIQLIIGIGYFYRQFGYEYALSYNNSRRLTDLTIIPKLGEGEKERYTLRKATLDDVPFLVRLSTKENMFLDSELGSVYDEKYWRWVVHGIYQNPTSRFDGNRITTIVRDEEAGRDIGFNVSGYVYNLVWFKFALEKGEPLHEIMYPVMRQMIAIGNKQCKTYREQEIEQLKAKGEKIIDEGKLRKPELSSMVISLPPSHPVRALLASKVTPVLNANGPQAIELYTRVNDYSAFVTKVAPELEARLARSAFAGATATLVLDFFRKVEGQNASGLEIVFEKGKIVRASPWKKPTPWESVEMTRKRKEAGLPKPKTFGAQFHPLAFTILLMGNRTVQEMLWNHGENQCEDEDSRMFLEALFPKVAHDFDLFPW